MSDEPTSGRLSVTAALAKDVYADIASPAAKQVGGALESVFKIGLSPIAMLDWGFEQTREWLVKRIEEKVASTPVDLRCQPTIAFAVAAVNGIASTADQLSVRDLYSELLGGLKSEVQHPPE